MATPGQGIVALVILDSQEAWRTDQAGTHDIAMDVSDHDGSHVLEFVMLGKDSHHTQLNASGEIVKDAVITVQDLAFDGIILGQVVAEQAVYVHDTNRTTALLQQPFYGTMGCNGTVRLEFTTPFYIWLLENL